MAAVRQSGSLGGRRYADLYIDEGLGGVTDERIDRLVLPLLLDHGPLHVGIHEIK